MVTLLVTLQFNHHFPGRLTGHFSISVVADADNVKDMLEVSGLMITWWKEAHPSDTEDEVNMGLTSEDEVEGMDQQPGIACRGGAVCEPQQGAAAAAGKGEVVVKKRALKHVKQQVMALLCGEDLPEGQRPMKWQRCHTSYLQWPEMQPSALYARETSPIIINS